MSAKNSSSQLFLSNNFNDDATCNEDDWLTTTRVKMIDNVKVALKSSNDALANEKQKRVNDRRMYETIITKITNHYKNKLQESRVSPCSQQSQSAQLARQSQQSARQSCVDQSVQTLHNHVADQSVQTESNDEESVGENAKAAVVGVSN